MKKWLAVPGFQRLMGRIFYISTVRQAAVMMQIVYKRDCQFFANRQQVTGCIQSIIVLKGQAVADIVRQTSNLPDQTLQGLILIPIGTAGMNVDHIGADPFRDLCLIA